MPAESQAKLDKIATKLTRLEITREDLLDGASVESSSECEADSATLTDIPSSASARKRNGKAKSASSTAAESKAKTAKIAASKNRAIESFSKSKISTKDADQNQVQKLQKELKEMKEMLSKCETWV